jgi:hypothetical protein
MTKPAAHCLDMTDDYYKSCGVSRGNNNGFDISKLKDGDIIFVKSDYIFNGTFQTYHLNSIKTKFILVSGVSSFSIDEGVSSYKDILENENLIKWFCTNPPQEKHEKIEWLPIGFEEKEREGGNQEILKSFYKEYKWEDKKDRIYIPYHGSTFGTRKDNIELVKMFSNVDVEENKLDFVSYLNKMSEYKYVLSLRGAGWDCHRHYESILVGSVPIMDGGPIMKAFLENNIPVFNISDIGSISFEKKYNFDKSVLLASFYTDKIFKCQKK